MVPLGEDLKVISGRIDVVGRNQHAPAVPDLAARSAVEALDLLVPHLQLNALLARGDVARHQGDTHGMMPLADRLGHDLSGFPLDEPVPDLPPSGMMQGHAIQLASIARRRRMTLRELRDYAAVSSGHRVVYGTASMIADDLETWFRSGAADGFIIQVTHHPGPLDEFVEGVLPILVERGLFRRDYQGHTLREHLGLARPTGRARQA